MRHQPLSAPHSVAGHLRQVAPPVRLLHHPPRPTGRAVPTSPQSSCRTLRHRRHNLKLHASSSPESMDAGPGAGARHKSQGSPDPSTAAPQPHHSKGLSNGNSPPDAPAARSMPGSYVQAAAQQYSHKQYNSVAAAAKDGASPGGGAGGDDCSANIDELRATHRDTGHGKCHLYTGKVPGLPQHHTSRKGLINKVQLSTYADAIGDGLQDLTTFMDQHLQGAVGSLHLLPLYPSSGDRGFGPITYQKLDPAFGTYPQLQQLGSRHPLVLEFMVNHVSPESPQFKDYLAKGDASPYADMFIRWDKFWPEGKPSVEDLLRIRTRKPGPPVLLVTLGDGTRVPLWCTFSPQQIDINPWSPSGRQFVEDSLRSICQSAGPVMLRIDAFGYATKRPGTSCFFLEPDVWELMDRLKKVVQPYGVQLLAEVHEDYTLNIALARQGYWVYDFALPLLIIHAMHFRTAQSLKYWMAICPRRQITVLDTHDGMGIDDVQGLAPVVDLGELQTAITESLGCNTNMKYYYTHPDHPDPSLHTSNGNSKGLAAGDKVQAATCDACEALEQAAMNGNEVTDSVGSDTGDRADNIGSTNGAANGNRKSTTSSDSQSGNGNSNSSNGSAGKQQQEPGQQMAPGQGAPTPKGKDVGALKDSEPEQLQVQQAPVYEAEPHSSRDGTSQAAAGAGTNGASSKAGASQPATTAATNGASTGSEDGAGDDTGCMVGTAESMDSPDQAPSWQDLVQPAAAAGSYKAVSHQYNCTYFSSMQKDPQKYLLARAIQFWTPGVPMVYYVGMLAGSNDTERVLQTGNLRAINRHSYGVQEAEEAVQQPVVQALLRLCRFRNQHPAFGGRFYLNAASPAHVLHATWKQGPHVAELTADMSCYTATIRHTPFVEADKPEATAAAAAAQAAAAVGSLDWREVVGGQADGVTETGAATEEGLTEGEEGEELEMVDFVLWQGVPAQVMTA